jgi:hypothetical protein
MHSHSLLGRDVAVYRLAYKWGLLLNPVVVVNETVWSHGVRPARKHAAWQSLADVFRGSRAIEGQDKFFDDRSGMRIAADSACDQLMQGAAGLFVHVMVL